MAPPLGVPEAPAYRPTKDEFADPLQFIASLREVGNAYGIVRYALCKRGASARARANIVIGGLRGDAPSSCLPTHAIRASLTAPRAPCGDSLPWRCPD